jgi:hypothetical protein
LKRDSLIRIIKYIVYTKIIRIIVDIKTLVIQENIKYKLCHIILEKEKNKIAGV